MNHAKRFQSLLGPLDRIDAALNRALSTPLRVVFVLFILAVLLFLGDNIIDVFSHPDLF